MKVTEEKVVTCPSCGSGCFADLPLCYECMTSRASSDTEISLLNEEQAVRLKVTLAGYFSYVLLLNKREGCSISVGSAKDNAVVLPREKIAPRALEIFYARNQLWAEIAAASSVALASPVVSSVVAADAMAADAVAADIVAADAVAMATDAVAPGGSAERGEAVKSSTDGAVSAGGSAGGKGAAATSTVYVGELPLTGLASLKVGAQITLDEACITVLEE